MPYVQRDEKGDIVGQFSNAQPGYAEEWVEDRNIPIPPVDWVALIAATRFEREVAGTRVQGSAVFTDRETQSKLTSAALRVYRDSSYSLDWKLSDGKFVSLIGDEIIAIADGVDDYVQACYSREAILLTELAAGTFTAAMLDEGWP